MNQRGIFRVGVRLTIVQDAIDEVPDLVAEGMVRNVTAVRHDSGKRGPSLLARPMFGENLMVTDRPLISEEGEVENVRLNALDGRRHLRYRPVLKFHQRQTVRFKRRKLP